MFGLRKIDQIRGIDMETHSNSTSADAIVKGKFASPCEDIFLQSEHVGTVYVWDDGLKTTVWFDGSKPEGPCVSRTHPVQHRGWQERFSIAS